LGPKNIFIEYPEYKVLLKLSSPGFLTKPSLRKIKNYILFG